jgi:hypothetical protein
MGSLLGGESPLGEEMVLTPSRRQRYQRERGREEARGETLHRGIRSAESPEADPCTEGDGRRAARKRRDHQGEPAPHGEARRHQEGGHVDATVVGGKQLFLLGETWPGSTVPKRLRRS